jgi:hypothetical protein
MKNLRPSTLWRSLKDRFNGGSVDERAALEVHEVAGIKAVFPYLPETRPRRLSICDADELPIQQSLFFQKLPLEIRRMVYSQIFGDRRLHIYLGPNEIHTEWEWRSCVCHRIWKIIDGKVHELQFYCDGCLEGQSIMCQWWPDKSECSVQALPWLQSCRQASVKELEQY